MKNIGPLNGRFPLLSLEDSSLKGWYPCLPFSDLFVSSLVYILPRRWRQQVFFRRLATIYQTTRHHIPSSYTVAAQAPLPFALYSDPIDQKYGPGVGVGVGVGGAHLSGLPVRAKYSPRPVLIYFFECQLLRNSRFCSERRR
jgi:hypothetical protein